MSSATLNRDRFSCRCKFVDNKNTYQARVAAPWAHLFFANAIFTQSWLPAASQKAVSAPQRALAGCWMGAVGMRQRGCKSEIDYFFELTACHMSSQGGDARAPPSLMPGRLAAAGLPATPRAPWRNNIHTSCGE
jgi:hypothetical protein